jgi:hypothetical protein
METFFDRMFQLWAYTVGHGQLLLRSVKSDSAPSRVDLAFKDVVALKLPSFFDQLAVEESSARQVALSESLAAGRRVWILRGTCGGATFEGFVVAGAMLSIEDDGEYNEPSQIFTTPP